MEAVEWREGVGETTSGVPRGAGLGRQAPYGAGGSWHIAVTGLGVVEAGDSEQWALRHQHSSLRKRVVGGSRTADLAR